MDDIYIGHIFAGELNDPKTHRSFYMPVNQFVEMNGYFENGQFIKYMPQNDLILNEGDPVPEVVDIWISWLKSNNEWASWMSNWKRISILKRSVNSASV